MYVAVKGGEKAIDAAHKLMAEERRGDRSVPALTLEQIAEQLTLAVDRVMNEGSLYDREWASLAIKQARGDLIEAIFLIRAARTTLARFGYTEPLNTKAMRVKRRVSAAFKDIPAGRFSAPHLTIRTVLLDFGLTEDATPEAAATAPVSPQQEMPRVLELLGAEGLIEAASGEAAEPDDLTQDPLNFPAGRDLRLQNLARGDEGFLLALAYSTQRGYGRTHPFAVKFAWAMLKCPSRRKSWVFHRHWRNPRHRMRDDQPVQGINKNPAAVHARLWFGFRPM